MSEKKQTNLRISPKAKATLKRRAAEEHRSMSAHLEHLIEQDARGFVKVPIKGYIDDSGVVRYDDPADRGNE